MTKSLSLIAIFAVMAVLVLSLPVQSAFSESGFTNVKKVTGIIMKFCSNETFTLQNCNERYEGLGWTDKINVLIYAPGWNIDSYKIDEIGGTTNPIDVYTDAKRVNNVEFAETGPDTGVAIPSDNSSNLFIETSIIKITPVSTDIDIPNWVKKNAMWWSDGQINDPDFSK